MRDILTQLPIYCIKKIHGINIWINFRISSLTQDNPYIIWDKYKLIVDKSRIFLIL